MEIYESIKILRKKANITQAELAERTGVHFQTVSKWERGASIPDVGMLGELAAALGVSLEELLGLPKGEIHAVGVFSPLVLGDTFADYRKGLGLSQTELAERLDVTSDAVSKWERGVISPDIENLVKAAELFGVSPSVLYYGIKKTDETEQTVYLQKSRSKRGLWIALACSGAALAVALTAVALIPRGKNYTLTVDGFTSYTVSANELFTPATPEKKGYEFVGFVDESGKAVELPMRLTSNSVVYPKFTPLAYDIDYWLGGGILEGEIIYSFTVEDEAVTLQIPQKAGDTFEGWYLTADYSGEAVTEIVCMGEEVRLYAKWSDESYTVRYVLNGGVCDGNPQTVTKAEEVALTEPIKGGHIFLGWYSSQEGGTRYEAVGGDAAKNITLYALWQKVDTVYEVNYVLNGGTLDGVNPATVAHGETYRLLSPTKKGYDFVCWNDQADGNGESYSWITGKKELTLYAVFAPKTYVVRYEYEGVYEKESNPSFIAYGETVSLNAVVREGYDFVGWYTKSSGGERVEKITAENIENISTLYAQYTPKKFSLSLFANGGSFEKGGEWVTEGTLSYEYDTTLPLPECKREKYTFLGWYDKAGNQVTEITVKTYHAGALTAKWFLADGYEITYELDGGEAMGELPAKAHSGEPQPLCGAKKEGYIFLGWNEKADGSGAYLENTPNTETESITLYAIWQAIIINGNVEDFTYQITATQVTVTGYTGEYGEHVDLVIPTFIEGLPVTAIGEKAIYQYQKDLRSIVLPKTLTTIETAGIVLKRLHKPIVIPKGVTRLGEGCMNGDFASVEFEEGSELKSFGNGAFKNLCIRDVLVLPEGIETLTAYCMPADCAGIILPQSLRKIASYAFDKYKTETALTVFIYLPNGVTEIGAKARCTTFIVYTDISKAVMSTFPTDFLRGDYTYISKYTVTLKDGDTVVGQETYGAFRLPILEKEGYNFLGWKNGKGEFVGQYYLDKNAKDAVLTAAWSPVSSLDGTSATTATVIKGAGTYTVQFFNYRDFYFYFETQGKKLSVTMQVGGTLHYSVSSLDGKASGETSDGLHRGGGNTNQGARYLVFDKQEEWDTVLRFVITGGRFCNSTHFSMVTTLTFTVVEIV